MELEWMEAKALRPSLRREMTQNELSDEICYTTTGVQTVSCDDFSIEELLNLQNGEFEDGSFEEEDEKDSLSLDDEISNDSGGFFVADGGDSESPLTSELAVPNDDLADLEWVSHFVDDSLSESLLYPLVKQRPEARSENRFKPEPKQNRTSTPVFPSVPVRTRTKRSRPTTQPWSSGHSLSLLTESESSPASAMASSSSSSSSLPVASFGFSSTPCLIFTNTVQNMDLPQTVDEPVRKKQKKKPAVQAGGGVQFQRRCSHCQVQKTPQWRTGPLGAKTLCNACGVRFKSGRLFPEYRPACSPTFCSDVHSNSHRRVLEMRKKKEVVRPGSGLTRVISSF